MGWVRVKKAAEILRMSPETVRQWSNTGKIECQRSAAGQRVFDEDYLRGLWLTMSQRIPRHSMFSIFVPLVGRILLWRLRARL